ncbi:thermonuclease family protein [Pseudaminobacter arsenicus]|uniref:Thermonuclease family protein n=1 Tax=Borborobacter arsenicus TaxID=1851146 RepID=A0A432VBP4_9HYPH|nr:thermonuclease family protein [Pseudaminobacter arsenicus]RUM99599.1 thermonuclease family protein [Pseudaminobacter arsenicus]
MNRMLWSGRQRRRPARRRNRRGKFLDYCLAAAILGLLVLVSARLDRVETRRIGGVAIINDGDSITLGTERIRLVGIDAPEYGQICRRNGTDYACGRQAREALAKLASGRSITCSGWERDRYGRLLAVCTADGVDLNRRQVEQGWAVAYGDYEEVEKTARRKRLGLWAGEFDVPRHWRDSHGGMVERNHDYFGAMLNWVREILRFS